VICVQKESFESSKKILLKEGVHMKRSLLGILAGIFVVVSLATAGLNGVHASDKIHTVKFSAYAPKNLYESAYLPWVKAVERETAGKLKFELFPYQQLMKAKAHLDGIRTGMADCGTISTPYYPGRFPMAEIYFLPFTWNSGVEGARVLHKFAQYQPIKDEFERNGVKCIVLEGSGPYSLASTRWVRTFEDMKGLKVRSFGTMLGNMLKLCGSIPISLPMPDTYQALKAGMLSACPSGLDTIYGHRMHEVAKYITRFRKGSFTYAVMPIVWGLQSWNKLPKDIQDAIIRVSESRYWVSEGWDASEKKSMDLLQKQGAEIFYMPEKETRKFVEKAEPLGEEWVEANKNNGPSRDVYDYFYSLLKQEGIR
jgi:TRAP-type C4-dicarboxylate transport system substrate-binding protein